MQHADLCPAYRRLHYALMRPTARSRWLGMSLIAVLLLVFLLDWSGLAAAFKQLKLSWFAVGLTAFAVAPVIMAQRWRMLLAAQDVHLGLWELLKCHAEGRVSRDGLAWVTEELLRRRTGDTIIDEDVLRFLDDLDMRPATEAQLDESIDAALAAADPTRFATTEKFKRHLMGRLMTTLIGRVEGRRLLERLTFRLADPKPQPVPDAAHERVRP